MGPDLCTVKTGPSWQMSLDDKQNLWEVTATDAHSTDPLSLIAHLNDGDLTTYYISEYVFRPWIQVDMKSAQLVKAVHLTAGQGWAVVCYMGAVIDTLMTLHCR